VEDLFGNNVKTLEGRLIEPSQPFTEAEAEEIVNEVIHGGELLEQLAYNLMRLRRLLKTEDNFLFGAARRDAWEDLMWVYDLYESPPYIPFDTACDVVGLDAEDIRSAISNEFGDELRRLSQTIRSRFPEKTAHLRQRLGKYIVLDLH